MKHLWIKGVTEVDKSGQSNVRVFARGEDGKKRSFLNRFDPYFYIKGNPKLRLEIKDTIDNAGKTIHNESLTKVVCNTPSDVPIVRKDYKIHYEADIPFNHRFQIDHGIKSCFEETTDGPESCSNPGIKPKCVCEDIETLDSVDTENAPQPVVSTCIKDEDTDRYAQFITTEKDVSVEVIKDTVYRHIGKELVFKVFKSKTEDELFTQRRQFLDVVIQPDVIFGWNYWNFDQAYMEKRSKKANFKKYVTFDLMDGYKKLSEMVLVSDKLDDVAKEELKINKLPRRSIKEMLENDVNTLIAYNIIDVYLTSEINKKREVINFHQMLAETAGLELDNTKYNGNIIDSVFLHYCHDKYVLPSKGMVATEGIDEGAFVHDPSSGVQENVAVLDLTRAYPTTIQLCNLSPETKLPEGFDKSIPHFRMPSGRCYRRDPMGIVPFVMKDIITQRKYYQGLKQEALESGDSVNEKKYDEMQRALKFCTNSAYGCLGSIDKKSKKTKFRLADGGIGSDITESIRLLVKWIEDHITDISSLEKYVEPEDNDIWNRLLEVVQKEPIKVVAGDTDSILFTFPKSIDKMDQEKLILFMAKLLNRSFVDFSKETFNADRGMYKVDFEKLFGSFFMGGKKKKYAGLLSYKDGVWIDDRSFEDRFYVRGLEVRRSDWPKLTKDKMNRLFEILLETMDKAEVSFFIQDLKSRFFQGEYNIIFKKPLSLTKWDYANNAQQLRTALHANEYLDKDFKPGDRLFVCYMKTVNKGPKVKDIAIEIDDDPGDFGEIDYDTMWEKLIELPFRRITDPIWGKNSWSELLSGLYEQNCEEWL